MKFRADTINCTFPFGLVPNAVNVTVRGEHYGIDMLGGKRVLCSYGEEARIEIIHVNGVVLAEVDHPLLSPQGAIDALESVFKTIFKEVI